MHPLAESILAKNDIDEVEIFVPAWQTKVTVRGMTGAQRDRFEAAYADDREKGNVRARLAAYCCYDAEGKRIFSDDQIPALAAKSAAALGRIFEHAARLSGITSSDVEDLEKN